MDYDLTDIPAGYDRGRDHGPEVLDVWMDAIESHLEGQTITRILDLGCGTGRFSAALAVRFGAEVVGIDPSAKMLERARRKKGDGRVQYQLGRAEAIPLLSHSVDMIFISMSLHHFTDQGLAARECRRVLRDQGTAFVRTGTRENIASYPYVPFFPSSRSMLEDLLPDTVSVREVFEAAGFHMVVSEIVTQTIAPAWPAYAEKLSAGADSVLARLSRQELESGLAALRSHSVEVDDKPVVEPIDLFVFRQRSGPTAA
ncbi:MAG: class I SAM-dependent methyltransferase [Blastocatellia bacterium]